MLFLVHQTIIIIIIIIIIVIIFTWITFPKIFVF